MYQSCRPLRNAYEYKSGFTTIHPLQTVFTKGESQHFSYQYFERQQIVTKCGLQLEATCIEGMYMYLIFCKWNWWYFRPTFCSLRLYWAGENLGEREEFCYEAIFYKWLSIVHVFYDPAEDDKSNHWKHWRCARGSKITVTVTAMMAILTIATDTAATSETH